MIFQSVGSICSGIEAASVAWEPLGMQFEWFSEIADFPSHVLAEKYPALLTKMGMKDCFGQSGKARDLLVHYELDSNAIVSQVKKLVKSK